jgi:cell division protein FtsB
MKTLLLLKNKYLITVIVMVTWLIFFDKNDVITQHDLIMNCEKLQKEKDYYLSEIRSHREQLHELKTNKKSLEKFSREKYLMKKDNEDVFVFVTR